MSIRKVRHIIKLNRSESKNGFPTENENTMAFEIYPPPNTHWTTLFNNSWSMHRVKFVAPEYSVINFGFDKDNPRKLTVTYPSNLDRRTIEQEMKKLCQEADDLS